MLTYLRFRLQRQLRRHSRRAAATRQNAVRYARYNLLGKGRQFTMIRSLVVVWWGLAVICGLGLIWQVRHLAVVGSVLQPLSGGTYTEGEVGSIKNLNPILPEGSATAAADRLIFNGLTAFDSDGALHPDLAKSWSLSPDGTTYTFHLRKGVKWQDGVPFTSQDVLFTLAAIQNPDTRSPLATSWQGVKVAAPNDSTVVFTLPKPYTPFISATTVGILPLHLLGNTEPQQLRVASFNQKPVGTGPFKVDQFDGETGEIRFLSNPDYYRGRPLLSGMTLKLYDSSDKAFAAYSHREVMGVGRLRADQVTTAQKEGTMKVFSVTQPDQVAVFFRMNNGPSQDQAVREALALATDRKAIIRYQLQGEATPLLSPLVAPGLNLRGVPHQPTYNLAQAKLKLKKDGWVLGSDGIRRKNGQVLHFTMVTLADSVYEGVARQLAEQWRLAGAQVDVASVDVQTLQQSYIRPRHYDLLLYGINVGADPDVYAYWDSSQAVDPGLNLSAYKSPLADKALEAGRTVQNLQLRAAKYRAFVQAWVGDTPAVMLYTPTYLYGVSREVYGMHPRKLITPADRFDGVEHWAVRVKVTHAR